MPLVLGYYFCGLRLDSGLMRTGTHCNHDTLALCALINCDWAAHFALVAPDSMLGFFCSFVSNQNQFFPTKTFKSKTEVNTNS